MGLSKRATLFLSNCERDFRQVTEQDICDAFEGNGAPSFQPLIDFELNYGGYMFDKGGAEPIKFSLLLGYGGYPQTTGMSIVEFDPSDNEPPKYFFTCASTDGPIRYALDEEGGYYEEFKPVATSFEKHIEQLALWDEIKRKGGYKTINITRKPAITDLEKTLELQLIPETSDQFTLWFCNEWIYLTYWQGHATLMVHIDYPYMDKLKIKTHV